MDRGIKANLNLAIGTLQWAVGAYCLVAGAMVLVAPHVLPGGLNVWVPQFRAEGGILSLAAGFALIGAAVTQPRAPLRIALHLFAGAVLCIRTLELYLSFGFYTSAGTHLAIGLGTLLAPLVATTARDAEREKRDWLSFVVAAFLILDSALFLRPPPGSEQGLNSAFFAAMGPLSLWYSAAFLAAGISLAAAEIHGGALSRSHRAAHVFAGAVLILSPLPNLRFRPWLGLAMYSTLGLAVGLQPWLGPLLGRLNPASLRVRVAVTLAALGAVPLIAMASLLAFRLEHTAQDQAFRLQESIAAAIARSAEDYLTLHLAGTRRIAAEPGLLRLSPKEQQAILERANVAFPQVTSFSIADGAGNNIAKSRGIPLISYADAPYFLETRRTNQQQVGVFPGRVVQGPHVVLTAPIHDREGTFAGMVAAGIATTRMAELVARTVGKIGGVAYILDSAGNMVVHTDGLPASSEPGIRRSLPNEGSVRYREATGDRLASAARIPQLGWSVVVDRPERIALADLYTQRNLTLAGLLAGTLASCLVGALAAGKLIKPLQSLAHATARLASGDASVPTVAAGVAEIDELRSAFETMRSRLAERTEQRDRAEAELHQLNRDLEARVRERTAELTIANAQLTEAERLLDQRLRELEAALADKQVLLKEVQHRVKNNLQVISSLLSLQAARVADAQVRAVFNASRDRIRSMSLIHEQLCFTGDTARIDFGDYVRDLARSLLDSYGAAGSAVRLHSDVDVKLGLDAAVPCGLIINELLSNSLKHAFPNGRRGEVWLDFHHRDGEFELRYRDNGVGLPPDLDIEQAESLGLQLITDLAAQLGGALEHDGRDGALFIVKFKSQKGPKESNKGGSHSDLARRG